MPRNKKHIAFFVPSLNIGGVESVFLTYSAMLLNRGYSVDFVVCKPKGALLRNLPKGVNLVHFNGVRLRDSIFKLRKYLTDTDIYTLLTGPDITNFIAILVNLSIPKKERVNLIVTQHSVFDNDAKDLGMLGRLIPVGKRFLYRYANNVIAVSNAVKHDLLNNGVPENKIHTIFNPIDIDKIKSMGECNIDFELPKKYILFVGRLNRVKNLTLLIKAFDLIIDEEVHLVIVGDGEQRKELEHLATNQKSAARIHFVGMTSNPYPFIKCANVVAIPSFSEAFPMVVIESAVFGKTMVYTPNPGCVEILGLDKVKGYCSNSFDDECDFADVLSVALNKPIDGSIVEKIAAELANDKIYPKIETLL